VRFFRFHEDGAAKRLVVAQKGAICLSGRRPFIKHSLIDYDNDSEGATSLDEGEELQSTIRSGSERDDYEDDEWLSRDETKADVSELVPVAIAPVKGMPLASLPKTADLSPYLAGVGEEAARELLELHRCIGVTEAPCCVDVFPSASTERRGRGRKHVTTLKGGSK
jgi:hypothetical protein